MFGKGRGHRKLADRIGKEIHCQLIKAFKERPLLFENAREIAFTAGYLSSFTFVAFSEIGCKDVDVHLRQIRYFCNGVLPDRLWDVFQRGEALNELSQGNNWGRPLDYWFTNNFMYDIQIIRHVKPA